uniref:Uncharacterized protein n=1 Tax=Photinus pyralis TaxID=7054 RepID=A0A1Y1N125_PHOPY
MSKATLLLLRLIWRTLIITCVVYLPSFLLCILAFTHKRHLLHYGVWRHPHPSLVVRAPRRVRPMSLASTRLNSLTHKTFVFTRALPDLVPRLPALKTHAAPIHARTLCRYVPYFPTSYASRLLRQHSHPARRQANPEETCSCDRIRRFPVDENIRHHLPSLGFHHRLHPTPSLRLHSQYGLEHFLLCSHGIQIPHGQLTVLLQEHHFPVRNGGLNRIQHRRCLSRPSLHPQEYITRPCLCYAFYPGTDPRHVYLPDPSQHFLHAVLPLQLDQHRLRSRSPSDICRCRSSLAAARWVNFALLSSFPYPLPLPLRFRTSGVCRLAVYELEVLRPLPVDLSNP